MEWTLYTKRIKLQRLKSNSQWQRRKSTALDNNLIWQIHYTLAKK
uniref:Uncharacterized protein n=1 Tax=Rhizophora mucronata TaxID=61149 RepID=A0A2P2PK99_RHIMU